MNGVALKKAGWSGAVGAEAELPPGCYLVERVIAARKNKVFEPYYPVHTLL